jgi:hypothetical protein
MVRKTLTMDQGFTAGDHPDTLSTVLCVTVLFLDVLLIEKQELTL